MLCLPGLAGLKAGVVGAAREGTALARYLAACGAQVTLSDSKTADQLGDRLADLAGVDVRLLLGGNPAELLDADVIFLSPGVPPTAAIVQQARAAGVPLSSEPRLFTQTFPGRVVGITGSAGKTTTTSLVAAMYQAGGRRTWLGGNIGAPLIARLMDDDMAEIAAMELSSFQLELFAPDYQGSATEQRRSAASRAVSLEGWSPPVAAITNITPNHLDRHPNMDDYVRCKAHLLAFQRPGDWAILNADSPPAAALASRTVARVLRSSLVSDVPEGVCLRAEQLWLRLDGREHRLCGREEIALRGDHNLANVAMAACCALAGGIDLEAMRGVARTFAGVPHRLEHVRVWRGVAYINDSIATAPERAMAALRAYDEPVVLLAGGRDKHLPWDEWADLALARARAVVAFGEAAPIIEQALAQARARRAASSAAALVSVATLDEAVARAAALAQPGDVVLLSPGGTSFDAYADFEARGAHYRALVDALGGTDA